MSWKTLLWPWGRIAELDAIALSARADARVWEGEALGRKRRIAELEGHVRSLEALLAAPLKEMTMQRVAAELARAGIEKIRDLVMMQTAKFSDRRASVQVTVPLDAVMFLGDRRSWETSLGTLVAEQWVRQSVRKLGPSALGISSQDLRVLRVFIPELRYQIPIYEPPR